MDLIPDKGDPGLEPDPGSDDEPSEEDYDVEYVEAEDERVEKSDGYRLVSGSESQGHGNTHIYYTETGTYVEYTFTGKAISVYTKTGPGAGTIDILIDGEQVGVDDQYTAAQQFNKRAFTKVFDEEGTHTIRLENNGLKNPSATGNSFNIDCFKVFKEKEAVKDSNADLASLSYVLNDGAPTAVEGFSAEKTSYEVALPAGTAGTVRLEGEAASSAASVQADDVEIVDGKAEAVLTVTAEDGTTKEYKAAFTVEEPEPEPPVITITLKLNGAGEDIFLQADENGHVTKPEDPVREGYVFGGWYTDEACTEAFDFENAVVTEDMTLYAKWTKIDDGEEEKPEDPGTPEKPGDVQKPGQADDSSKDVQTGKDAVTPKTGDNTQLPFGYAAAVIGAGVLAATAAKRRKTKI